MGRITSTKLMNNDKIQVNLELTHEEALWLKGNLNKIHVFSENNLEFETRLIKRGKRESSKYFLLPKELRDNLIPSNKIACNKIETKTKQIIIFAVPKYEDND